jgi:hypothetical protein
MQAAAVVNRAPAALCRAGILPASGAFRDLCVSNPRVSEMLPVPTLNHLNSLIRRRATHTHTDPRCLRGLHL